MNKFFGKLKGVNMHLAVIPVLGSVFDFISANIITILGGTGAIVMAVVTWLSKKHLLPYLLIEKRRKYSRYIAAIADDVPMNCGPNILIKPGPNILMRLLIK